MRAIPKLRFRKTICVLLVLMILVIPISSLASGYVTTANVNFRKGGSTETGIIRTLKQGTEVEVTEYNADGWSRVTYNGKEGFMKSDYIKALPDEEAVALDVEAGQKLWVKTSVNFRESASTEAAVIKTLKAGAEVTMLAAVADGWSKVKLGESVGYIKSKYLADEDSYSSTGMYDVELLQWSKAKEIFTTFEPAKVYDVRSGAVYYVQSFSNGKHADVEPLTKADTDILKKTFDGKWSWSVRPVWVTINGHTMAASINGMPHASGTIADNGMSGQVCIHFSGSTTHNGNKNFAKVHQNGVVEAWNARNPE